MARALSLTGALLLVVGCGTHAGVGQPPSPTASPPPPDGGSYATPADIIAKAGTALPCADASPMTPVGAKAQSMCDDGETVIRIYADHSGIDEQLSLLGMAGGARLLTGENWSVNAPQSIIETLRVELGGKVVQVKCQSNC